MNDVVEIWSLPWHRLQRSLAQAVGAQAVPRLELQHARPPREFGAAGSWLMRARDAAAQVRAPS